MRDSGSWNPFVLFILRPLKRGLKTQEIPQGLKEALKARPPRTPRHQPRRRPDHALARAIAPASIPSRYTSLLGFWGSGFRAQGSYCTSFRVEGFGFLGLRFFRVEESSFGGYRVLPDVEGPPPPPCTPTQ